jgi:hypothetical protein
MSWRSVVHWRKAQIARRAARRLPGYNIGWAVIAPSTEQPGGWDYHLINTEWGIGAARRLRSQLGGWILRI